MPSLKASMPVYGGRGRWASFDLPGYLVSTGHEVLSLGRGCGQWVYSRAYSTPITWKTVLNYIDGKLMWILLFYFIIINNDTMLQHTLCNRYYCNMIWYYKNKYWYYKNMYWYYKNMYWYYNYIVQFIHFLQHFTQHYEFKWYICIIEINSFFVKLGYGLMWNNQNIVFSLSYMFFWFVHHIARIIIKYIFFLFRIFLCKAVTTFYRRSILMQLL